MNGGMAHGLQGTWSRRGTDEYGMVSLVEGSALVVVQLRPHGK